MTFAAEDLTPPYGTPLPYAPTMHAADWSVPAPSVHEAPTLRSGATRDWRDASRELEAYICAMFDEANTLPPGPLLTLMAELKRLRGE